MLQVIKKLTKYAKLLIFTISVIFAISACNPSARVLNNPTINASESKSETGSEKQNHDKSRIDEDGTYTSKDEVALYIATYKKLPKNYITKSEAKKLGWNSSKNYVGDVAKGKSIGGDRYGNYEKRLPIVKGRKYIECDIDYKGKKRNAKRIIYADDFDEDIGYIYYTDDHYKTFTKLY